MSKDTVYACTLQVALAVILLSALLALPISIFQHIGEHSKPGLALVLSLLLDKEPFE